MAHIYANDSSQHNFSIICLLIFQEFKALQLKCSQWLRQSSLQSDLIRTNCFPNRHTPLLKLETPSQIGALQRQVGMPHADICQMIEIFKESFCCAYKIQLFIYSILYCPQNRWHSLHFPIFHSIFSLHILIPSFSYFCLLVEF